jgi:glucokinase
LGFDIGGTKCAVILGELHGDGATVLERAVFATDKNGGPGPVLARLADEARRLCGARGVALEAVRGIGISCGGPLDRARGVILSPPNLPGWDDVPIVAHFERTLGIPTRLENDANACALAEHRWGAGRGCRHMIFLTFGTGMGAGLILNGELYAGANDLAGEVGHVRLAEDGPVGYGKAGSFEGFCSGGGIAEAARAAVRRGIAVSFAPEGTDLAEINALVVAEAAARGDVVAQEIFTTAARYLGRGLAMLIDVFNPERIILGGIFGRCRELLWPIAKSVIEQEALPAGVRACQILPAALGESIGDHAALFVASTARK